MYKILVPLDGSQHAAEALPIAIAVAEQARQAGQQASIEILRVRPIAPRLSLPMAPEPRSIEEEYVHRARERAAARTTIEISAIVRTGAPVTTICARAAKSRASLIVMTTHGRTGVSRAWLGSVADGVVRESNVPVLLHRSHEKAPIAPARAPQHFLVPLDGSPVAEQVLDRLLPFLKTPEAELTLVRVEAPVPMLVLETTEPNAFLSPAVVDEQLTQQVMDQARQYLARTARWLHEHTPAHVETRAILDGRVAHAILEAASLSHADAIAMTTRGRGASRLVVGSVADKVLRGTTLPLLMFRPRAQRRAERMPPPRPARELAQV